MPEPVHVTSGSIESDIVHATVKAAALGTSVGSTLEVDVADVNGITIQLRSGGTAGGVIVAEGLINDGSAVTWATVGTGQSTTGTPASINGTLTTLAASTNYRYTFNVTGVLRFRLRVTTALGAALADLSYVTHTETPPMALPVILTGTGAVTQSGSWTVTATPASGTNYNLVTTASTNLNVVRNAAASLYELTVSNPTATPTFVKLYNKSSSPTLASDVPVLTVPVAAGALVTLNFGAVGKRFGTGIAIAAVANAVANDATATVAGIQINATYI